MKAFYLIMIIGLLSCQAEPKEAEKATAPEPETVVVFDTAYIKLFCAYPCHIYTIKHKG